MSGQGNEAGLTGGLVEICTIPGLGLDEFHVRSATFLTSSHSLASLQIARLLKDGTTKLINLERQRL